MPLLGPTSYPATLRVFVTHWGYVNARLGAGDELVLPDGLSLAGALALEAELEGRMEAGCDAGVELALARAEWQLGRTGLRARLGQFCDLVRAYWVGTPWVGLVPNLPQVTGVPEKLLAVAREALRLWALLEVEPAPAGASIPITLAPGGVYGRADFAAELALVAAAALAVEEAQWGRSVALARRDATLARVKAALMAFNRAVPGRLPAGDALIATLPALWPPPGHTPEAVALSGAWVPAEGAARFTWPASEEKTLERYELRGCAGAEYEREAEVLLARVPAAEPREATTAELLPAPGEEAAFRLYVVLETGNERGSATVLVARPGV